MAADAFLMHLPLSGGVRRTLQLSAASAVAHDWITPNSGVSARRTGDCPRWPGGPSLTGLGGSHGILAVGRGAATEVNYDAA
jgi:hypothetical protein